MVGNESDDISSANNFSSLFFSTPLYPLIDIITMYSPPSVCTVRRRVCTSRNIELDDGTTSFSSKPQWRGSEASSFIKLRGVLRNPPCLGLGGELPFYAIHRTSMSAYNGMSAIHARACTTCLCFSSIWTRYQSAGRYVLVRVCEA